LHKPMAQSHGEAFLRLRSAILEDYSYRDLRGVDWKNRFARFGPGLRASSTTIQFAQGAARLLSAAQDVHLWLRVKNQTVPTYRRCAQWNVALSMLPRLIPNWRQHNEVVMSGRFPDGTVYLCLRAWPGEAPAQLRPAYRLLREAAATRQPLIIDVRANGGGAEPLAGRFAGCFIRRSVRYAKHLTLCAGALRGPMHRRLKPNQAGPHYRGRVAVLVGPGTVSSCESFVMMMRQAPGCKLIGARTAGASGNPKPVDLGNGVVAFIPSWQDLDLEGGCIEGRGIAPDIKVRPRWPSSRTCKGASGAHDNTPRCRMNAAFRSQPEGRIHAAGGSQGRKLSCSGASVEGRCPVPSTLDTRHSSSDPVLAVALAFLRGKGAARECRRTARTWPVAA